MGIISTMRRQKAVYWPFLTDSSQRVLHTAYGKQQFDLPVEIDCRWEDVSEQYLDSQGNIRISKSVVYADRLMDAGEYLMLGSLSDVADNDPLKNPNAFEIKRFDSIPNLKNTEILLMAYL